MAPNLNDVCSGVLNEDDDKVESQDVYQVLTTPKDRKIKIVWRNIIIFGYLHLSALYGVYLAFTSAKLLTTLMAIFLYQVGAMGITAGAHRLWAHRCYKAKWQLRVILIIMNTIAFQDPAIHWARDHRVHHKYSETDADPHNAKRGFFFAHVGWLLVRKLPEVRIKGKCIDISDLKQDKILMFQKKYYAILMPLLCFIIPTLIPIYFWNESFINSWCVGTILRYVFTLNITWLVNSAAHIWGWRPYDNTINPSENATVAILALGEGWHNYHHVFPWDYKTSEYSKYRWNPTCAFIDFFAKIGWAYDLKTVPQEVIKKRVQRTGDGSHEVWGWGDKDQPENEKELAITLNKRKNVS